MPETDNRIFYKTKEGKGKALVFIHGWLGSHKSWQPVDRNLDTDNPRVFYDLRCHGDSQCSRFSFETLAKDLERLLTDLKLENPILVGHSMGGMVALTYAKSYDNFSGLFLAGSCASTPEPENHSPRFFLEKFGSINRKTWAELIVENYAPETDHPEVKSMVVRELLHANDTEIIYSLGSMLKYDVRDNFKGLDKPASVVAGEKDGAITMDKSEELAELLECPLHRIDSSHLMLQEKPEKVAELLEQFLNP